MCSSFRGDFVVLFIATSNIAVISHMQAFFCKLQKKIGTSVSGSLYRFEKILIEQNTNFSDESEVETISDSLLFKL